MGLGRGSGVGLERPGGHGSQRGLGRKRGVNLYAEELSTHARDPGRGLRPAAKPVTVSEDGQDFLTLGKALLGPQQLTYASLTPETSVPIRKAQQLDAI